MVYFAPAVETVPEEWWNRIAAGFARSEVPAVTVTELLTVVLVAVVLSVPSATWRYFGLFATVTHELGHAFAALTSGQRLGGIKLRLNHSGTTTSFTRGRFAAVWSGFWGYPVPGVTGAALVWSGFNGWGPAAMSAGLLVLLASLIFIRNAAGVLILLATVLCAGALVLAVPSAFTGHVAIILGLALLVAAVRGLDRPFLPRCGRFMGCCLAADVADLRRGRLVWVHERESEQRQGIQHQRCLRHRR